MNLVVLILQVMFAMASDTHAVAIKRKQFEVVGLGIAQLLHESLGEPISAPERITVNVKCKTSGRFEQLALYRTCRLEDHKFDPVTKMLRLTLVSARVVPTSGEVICDQIDRKEIELFSRCR